MPRDSGAVDGRTAGRRLDRRRRPTDHRGLKGCCVITEHSRFQLEATKLGRELMFQVTVFEREERRRKKLFAETQCSDPFHLVIQFIIREAPDFETLLQRFVAQLEHRGFQPTRMRTRLNEKWQDWAAVPYISGAVIAAQPDPPVIETSDAKKVTSRSKGA